MITIYALQCPDFMKQREYFSLLTRVSAEKQKQIQRFRQSEDASRALWAALLLRALIKERTGLPNHRIRFSKNRYQKPFLTASTSLHFNLSHSGRWILCALDTEPVGADIEIIQEITPGTIELSLSSQEQKQLKKMSPGDQLSYFFTLWTWKESYLKARGTGLNCLPGELVVKSNPDKETGTVFHPYKQKRGFCRSYAVIPGYKAAVCSFQNRFPRTVIRKDIQSVIHTLE